MRLDHSEVEVLRACRLHRLLERFHRTTEGVAAELGVDDVTRIRWDDGQATPRHLERIVACVVPSHVEVLDWLNGESAEDPFP
jgi:hypothetical protein